MSQVYVQNPAIRREADALEDATATEIIEWALARYGARLCATTSFYDTVLVHLATQVDPDIEVIFLDTGYHFPETLATMREALHRYQLRLRVVRPEEATAPGALTNVWSDGTTSCCDARKVRPLNHAMAEGGFDAWLSGLRRADSAERQGTGIVQTDRHGRTKINPIANWNDDMVAHYIADNDLVVNPLAEQGYASVGCWPCTEPGGDRSGRWSGEAKTECGLHLPNVETTVALPSLAVAAAGVLDD